MVTRKLQLTSVLISKLNLEISVETALSTWYRNIRINGGYRLSDAGYTALDQCSVESWYVTVEDFRKTIDKKTLLQLDQKIQYPYYLDYKNKKIVFFSSKDALMAGLYGDLKTWLMNCESRKP